MSVVGWIGPQVTVLGCGRLGCRVPVGMTDLTADAEGLTDVGPTFGFAVEGSTATCKV